MTDFAYSLVGLSALVVIFGLIWTVVMLIKKRSAKPAIQTVGAGCALLLLGVLLTIPGERQAEVDGSVLTYEELLNMIEEQEGVLEGVESEVAAAEKTKSDTDAEIEEKEGKIAALDEEIETKQAEVDEINAMIEGKGDLEEEISGLNSQLEEKQAEKEDVEGQISAKKEELVGIDTSIQEKQDDPVELPAGHFTIGEDVPPARYKVVPLGQGSNFIVYSRSGSLLVNTILDKGGSSGFGVEEYIFEAPEGGTIESDEPVQMVPVE